MYIGRFGTFSRLIELLKGGFFKISASIILF